MCVEKEGLKKAFAKLSFMKIFCDARGRDN